MKTTGKQLDRILLIDGDVHFCETLRKSLPDISFTTLHTAKHALEIFKKGQFDLVICNEFPQHMTGIEVMKEFRNINPRARFVLTGTFPKVRSVVHAIKAGADNYLVRPFTGDVIKELFQLNDMRTKIIDDSHHRATVGFGVMTAGFWKTDSQVMNEALKETELIASTTFNVIVYGETGTGKEMIAQLIHEKSKRRDQPFVAVDCGTLTRELASSVFFGHKKGSFTGAIDDRQGCFETAHRGTLFLDEVGNLPVDIQILLLRAIQERKCRAVGGIEEYDIDVRLIVASNEKLEKAYNEGRFRKDLFHRLNEFRIDLPPLRKRQEDVLPLARFFLTQASAELGREPLTISEQTVTRLMAYPWPGNLRELRNAMRRGCLLTRGAELAVQSLPLEVQYYTEKTSLENSKEEQTREPVGPTDLKTVVKNQEKKMILEALATVRNNKTKVAKMLNIDRKTLYNKLYEYGIHVN